MGFPNTAALHTNGVFDEVFARILDAQKVRGGGESFLQPFKDQAIRLLREACPSPEKPLRLYASTTEDLNRVCYVAEIVHWEDKRKLSPERREEVKKWLAKYQPIEVASLTGEDKGSEKSVNLITIRRLVRLDSPYSTSLLVKVSDGKRLKPRTRAGGWSPVYDIGEGLPVEPAEQHRVEMEASTREADSVSDDVLSERLASAPKVPERIQIASTGFRRNPGVVIAVLRRAKGACERCGSPAPFLRQSDGSPYLEIHHWLPLADGGEDSVENAAALCPNCHREEHFGQSASAE